LALSALAAALQAQAPAGKSRIHSRYPAVFEKSCYSCHGPKMQMAGLRLDENKRRWREGNPVQ
jgi:mono/diheme cytochrome c family protein